MFSAHCYLLGPHLRLSGEQKKWLFKGSTKVKWHASDHGEEAEAGDKPEYADCTILGIESSGLTT